jgi:fatty-acyl-CoA synthase
MHVPLTPIRCLYRGVDLYGSKIGVVSGPHRFTYSEFGERCERLAAGLKAQGVEKGDRVAYLCWNSHELLEGYFGVPLAGAIVMPLNVRLTAPELSAILNHAEPCIVIYQPEFSSLVETLRSCCSSVRQWMATGEPYESLLSQDRIARPDPFAVDETAIAELFYTSGSTGAPKGVMLSHRTLYLHALSVVSGFVLDDRQVELHTIPLFHANGWGRAHSSTMCGLRQVMVRRFDPVHVLRLICDERATGMALVPTMAYALLNCPELPKADVSSMQRIMIGGAASSPELIARMEQAFRCRVEAGYGLTETSPVVACARPKDTVQYLDKADRCRRQAMAGWPVLGCEVRVVDSELRDVPRDLQAIGEVVIRGDNVMDGYYRDPGGTAEVLNGGWLRTGDMAVWDEDHYIQIVDRKKDIIVSGGENISSIEVEQAILAHPAVVECAVVSSPDPHWGEVPAAFIVLKASQTVTEAELSAFLQTRIAKFKVPRIFQFLHTPLPKTGTGKILKRSLREIFWQGQERRVHG